MSTSSPCLPAADRPDQGLTPVQVVTEARALVEGTTLPMRVIAARVGLPRSTLSKLKRRHGWRRPFPARIALAGQRGGGHPIVPAVMAEARTLLEGESPDRVRLSFAAVSARTGASTTTLCRWCKRGGWRRPAAGSAAPVRPARYRRGRGRPYAADAVGVARRLVTTSLLPQAAIARTVGISQAQVSVWMREHGWVRPSVPSASKRFAAAARRGPLAQAGDRRGRPYAPEVRREARALWELTRLPTAIIGTRIGAHAVTVARWAKQEAWERPRGRAGARQLRGFFGAQRRQAGG